MTLPGEGKKLTVCLYLSGIRPRESLALIDSMLTMPGASTVWDLYVAVYGPSYEVRHIIQREYQSANKCVFFESGVLLGKEALSRVMMANVRSEYALFLDDATKPSPGWFGAVSDFIRDYPDKGLVGFKHAGGQPSSGQNPSPSIKAGPVLVKTSWYREHEHVVSDDLAVAQAEVGFFDFSMAATLGVFPDALNPFEVSRFLSHDKTDLDQGAVDSSGPLFTICVCSYGNHPELILRCLDSILLDPLDRSEVEIILGCNQVAPEVMHEIDRRYNDGFITSIIRSHTNFNKAGMQRFMFRMARAPYVLSLDDDMRFKRGWSALMRSFILESRPFDVAGRLHSLSNRTLWSGQKKPYDSYCQKKRWWRGKQPYGLEVVFPAGQCFLARTRFVLDNDYPDLDMRIDWDDVLLGDMVTQLDGKQIWFSEAVKESIVVDNTPSRGQHGSG
jgi:GT2 family glycosyltransferase